VEGLTHENDTEHHPLLIASDLHIRGAGRRLLGYFALKIGDISYNFIVIRPQK